jgi:hypothetical protein
VLGALPALVGPELGQHERGRLERTVAVAQGYPDAGITEPDDVGVPVAGEVGDVTRVLVDPPPLVVAEALENQCGRHERTVAVAQGHPDAGVTEPDDVGVPVAGQVGDVTRVLVDPPVVVTESAITKCIGSNCCRHG